MKKIPQRMCLVCRQMLPKNELTRVVRTPDDKIVVDTTGKMSGRGAYICSKQECRSKVSKQKSFNKAFKMNIDESIYKSVVEGNDEPKD